MSIKSAAREIAARIVACANGCNGYSPGVDEETRMVREIAKHLTRRDEPRPTWCKLFPSS